MTLTTKEFIAKATLKHSNKYTYLNSKYVSTRKKLTITCKIHGDFEQTPYNHLKGNGCLKCSYLVRGANKAMTPKKFIENAIRVHKNQYCYDKTKYTRSTGLVTITCREHGDFTQVASSHTGGSGCPQCARITTGTKLRSSTSLFITNAIAVHGKAYDYSKVHYVTSRDKVIIICNDHGDFTQTPSDHLQGVSCPKCGRSAGGGCNPNKPGTLYFLSINDGEAYKIGVTGKTIKARYTNVDLPKIKILALVHYLKGSDANAREQEILKEFTAYKYSGAPLLQTGNTELLTINLLTFNKGNYTNDETNTKRNNRKKSTSSTRWDTPTT